MECGIWSAQTQCALLCSEHGQSSAVDGSSNSPRKSWIKLLGREKSGLPCQSDCDPTTAKWSHGCIPIYTQYSSITVVIKGNLLMPPISLIIAYFLFSLFLSRLFGLKDIIKPGNCSTPYDFSLNTEYDWPVYVNPGILFLLYINSAMVLKTGCHGTHKQVSFACFLFVGPGCYSDLKHTSGWSLLGLWVCNSIFVSNLSVLVFLLAAILG